MMNSEIIRLMQEGMQEGCYFDVEWYVDVVKKYTKQPGHTTDEEALLHKFIAKAYEDGHIDFLQYMPDFIKFDYDFWGKVYDELTGKTDEFWYSLISEYLNNDYDYPDDIRWYESLAEEEHDYGDEYSVYEIFLQAYLSNNDAEFRRRIIANTSTWFDNVGCSYYDFFEPEELETMGAEESEFHDKLNNFDWRTYFYQQHGIIPFDDESEADDDDSDQLEDHKKQLENFIQTFKRKLPLSLGEYISLSDLYLDGEFVAFDIVVNKSEGNINLDNIKLHADTYKDGTLVDLVANANELVSVCQRAGKGIRLHYRNSDDQSVDIDITCDELEYALQHPQEEQQQLEQQVRGIKASCPRDLGEGLVFSDCSIDGDFVTRTITVDETQIDMDSISGIRGKLLENLANSVLDPANFSFISLVYKLKMGLRDSYVGTSSGMVIDVDLSHITIEVLIEREVAKERKIKLIRGCVTWIILIAAIVALIKWLI